MSRRQAASNETTVTVPVFTLDPRGWGMFERLSAMHQRGLNGTAGGVRTGEKSEPGKAFYGYAAPGPSAFSGLGGLRSGLGGSDPVRAGASDFVHQRSSGQLDDPARRIFAERLRRRR